jgi:hypothetical protein
VRAIASGESSAAQLPEHLLPLLRAHPAECLRRHALELLGRELGGGGAVGLDDLVVAQLVVGTALVAVDEVARAPRRLVVGVRRAGGCDEKRIGHGGAPFGRG